MKNFDLIIIGGGAGAFASAIRANELGARTTLINSGLPVGGTCVNVGCVPSKRLLWAGEIMHRAKTHGISGIEMEVKGFDFQKVIQDELALIERLRKEKYERVLSHLEHVTHFPARAKFVGEREIEADGEIFRAEEIVIATGSTASIPPIGNIQEVGYVTHIEALKLEKQPRELIVIGGGPLGLEFSQMYARFGTKVTVLQRRPSIFPHSEEVLIDRLTEILTAEGIDIKTNVKARNAKSIGGKKIIDFTVDGKEGEVAADEILLAAGKTPNTRGLGLEEAGVETDGRQAIMVNRFCRTSNPNIFAVGDVTDLPLRLETTAAREGTLAAENALKGTELSLDYNTVPYTIFTDPQLAGVGLTEERQMQEMGVCACRTVSFTDVAKALIMQRPEGLIKRQFIRKQNRFTAYIFWRRMPEILLQRR